MIGSHHIEQGRLMDGYSRGMYLIAKRTTDLILAGVALVVLAPAFAFIAALIAAVDGLPVVFRQVRVGERGKPFTIYKFRTMRVDAEKVLAVDRTLFVRYARRYKLENDPRITRLGRLLRASLLDELPQLWNVIRGELSLVGPRPVLPDELEKYGDDRRYYLAMRPGCTGLWQCSGRHDLSYSQRVELDRRYYYRASLAYDARILIKTLIGMVCLKGAPGTR